MKLTIIGDVHGKVHEYKKIINKCEFSICVGDFGFQPEWDYIFHYLENLYSDSDKIIQHWINMGNHDYIPYLNIRPSLLNHTWFSNERIFTIRGAESIDKHHRIEGLDWFPNEELTYEEQLTAFDEYCKVKPKIVISHDCPQSVMVELFGFPEKSQTRTMLEMMLQEHEPELWIFGHHHKNKDVQINGTRFVCLAELETFEIEI